MTWIFRPIILEGQVNLILYRVNKVTLVMRFSRRVNKDVKNTKF